MYKFQPTINIKILRWIRAIFTRFAGLAFEAKVFIAAFTSPALVCCVVLIAFVASKPSSRINNHIMVVGAFGSCKRTNIINANLIIL